MFNKYNFKVLHKDIPLNIKGFNSSYEYVSKLVEFDLKFGQETQAIQAWCVPSILIDLDLPNLNVIVKEFTKKGYDLADKRLLNGADIINEVDLVLGTNFVYCILFNSVSFGSPKPSVYLNCPMGVLLLGKIDEIYTYKTECVCSTLQNLFFRLFLKCLSYRETTRECFSENRI